jgi:hypothetical protein
MTDLQHKPVFKNTHFECSICGQLWRLDATFEMMALIPCTPKQEITITTTPGSIMITFDPPLLLDSGQAIQKGDEGDEISITATGEWTYGVFGVEGVEGSAEEKGTTLIDTWLKDTGDAP